MGDGTTRSCFGWVSNLLSCSLFQDSVKIGKKEVLIGDQIAEGGFSFVYIAVDKNSGEKYALKRMNVQSEEQIKAARQEIEYHKQFDHKHLLKVIDHSESVVEGKTVVDILFPLCKKGSLRDFINRMSGLGEVFSERKVLTLFLKVCDGVKEMHTASKPLAHHDIKLDNVLLTEDHIPILMDFGSVSPAEVDVKDRGAALELQEWAAQNCTMAYRAPELFDPRGSGLTGADIVVDTRTDVWSLGCLLYALVYGWSPFESEITEKGTIKPLECTYLRVINGISFPKPTKYSPEFRKYIQSMLEIDAQKRPNIQEVIKQGKKLLKKLEKS